MLVCWSAKGGSGTTVVSAALGLLSSHSRPTLLVDLAGDLPAALGMAEPLGPGVAEWLASPTADGAALHRLAATVTDTLRLVHRGSTPVPAAARWADLAAVLQGEPAAIVDAGNGAPPAALVAAAAQSLLVIRPCYLALRQAVHCGAQPTGIVLLVEPGRSLGPRDVEHALRVPVVAEVPYDPAVARAVDAGLLSCRMPRTLAHPLRAAA